MILCCVLLCLAADPAVPADDAKVARALVDKAIVALGGAKAVRAAHTMTGTGTGTLHLNGANQKVRNRFTAQGIDRLRWEIDINGGTLRLGLYAKGVWISANGIDANATDKDTATAFRRGVAALRVAECPTLLLEKGWTLAPLGELKIDDTAAVGIKASRKGEPDIDLWLDAKTHLPLRVEYRFTKPGESAETTLRGTLSDYRKMAGRKHFGKMVVHQDGNLALEIERSDVENAAPVAEETFSRP
jgi:outer membrane lipoprotein-sorting protein